ncbi:MAG: hypothetical protein ABSF76_04970 [Opitutaceae bacterium]|jgi:hypothetical protein
MILQKLVALAVLLLWALVGLSFCSRGWRTETAPKGFAVVREHVVTAPRNHPPIRSTLDFTLVQIDGAQVHRETPPPFVDMQPGAIVSAGTHQFKARVQPHLLPRGFQPREVTFTAAVEGGRIYDLVDDPGGAPVLVEQNRGAR